MKICLLFLLLTSSCVAFGQQLPFIETNTDQNEQKSSIIYKAFQGQYDFLIAYSEDSYWWSDRRHYKLIANNDGKWFRLTYGSRKKKNGTYTKPTITKQIIEDRVGELMLSQFSQIGFWNLNRDSLNNVTKKVSETSSIRYTSSDGVNYKFEILTKDSFRIIEAYEPEYFLEKLPEYKQRQKFIIGRNLYKTLVKNYGTNNS